MDESQAIQDSLIEELQFRPRWWWDPVPPFLRDKLTLEVLRDLTVIQLEKRNRILEVEQIAMKDTIAAMKNVRG